MAFLYVKALHIIFVVTWFSGMFYLCRLYIYNREANDKPEAERTILQAQFNIMIKRLLLGITWPSAVLTLIFGVWLLLLFYPSFSMWPTWLYIKLGLLVILFIYNYTLHIIYQQQKNNVFKHSSSQLRMWNEVPTLILVAVVMLVVVRQNISLLYGLVGIVLLSLLILFAIKMYKSLRKSN